MGQQTRGYPPVFFSHTEAGALAPLATLQVNLTRAAQTQAVRDQIPRRLHNSLKGTIEGMALWINTAGIRVPMTIRLFGNDLFDNFATGFFVGDETFVEADFTPVAGTGMAYIGSTNIEYEDLDDTGEFHFTIHNEDAADTIAAGDFRIDLLWRPFFAG